MERRLNWVSPVGFPPIPDRGSTSQGEIIEIPIYSRSIEKLREGSDRETTLEIFIIRAVPLYRRSSTFLESFKRQPRVGAVSQNVLSTGRFLQIVEKKKKDRFASLPCHDLIDRFVRLLLGWRLRYVVYSLCTIDGLN